MLKLFKYGMHLFLHSLESARTWRISLGLLVTGYSTQKSENDLRNSSNRLFPSASPLE
jgi:hypothetical protein